MQQARGRVEADLRQVARQHKEVLALKASCSYPLHLFTAALYTLYRNTKLALILSDLASKRKCSLQGGIHSKYPTAPASLRKDYFGAMLHGCGCRIVVFCLLPPASFVTQIYRGVSGLSLIHI